jgi:hypothetical protein
MTTEPESFLNLPVTSLRKERAAKPAQRFTNFAVIAGSLGIAILLSACSSASNPEDPPPEVSDGLSSICETITADLNDVAPNSNAFMSTNIGDFDQTALTSLITDFENIVATNSDVRADEKSWLTNAASAADSIARAQSTRSNLDLGTMLLYNQADDDIREACG